MAVAACEPCSAVGALCWPRSCAQARRGTRGGRRWVPLSRCPPSSCLTPVRHAAAGEGVRAAKGGQVLFATRSQQTSVLEALTLEERKGCLQIRFPCPSDMGDASEPHHSWEQRGLMGPCGSVWPLGGGRRSVLVPDAWSLDHGGPPSGARGWQYSGRRDHERWRRARRTGEGRVTVMVITLVMGTVAGRRGAYSLLA